MTLASLARSDDSAPRIACALERGEEGLGLSREDARLLMEEAPLESLLLAASSLRDRLKGRVVSYSKKIFIPLTHLCRDYCGYCTFRSDPVAGRSPYMNPDEVLAVAEAGARKGCKEALFSLGDQPERIFPEAREFLGKLGFTRTLDYLAAMTELVFEKTGLLPHSNPGLMGREDLSRLRQTNVSLGLMLESISPRLRHKEAAHWRAPDKAPALRLRTIEEAGRQKIVFTTGLLIGIGETLEERVDSLFAILELHKRYGHIQEVLIQPFRAKGDTRMASAPEPSIQDLQRTLAVARLILGDINVQSPPNLVSEDYPQLLAAGINDWGGISPVTRDFINPEAAWPQIPILEQKTPEAAGFALRERLAIYPEFARGDFINVRLMPGLDKQRGGDFYAREDP